VGSFSLSLALFLTLIITFPLFLLALLSRSCVASIPGIFEDRAVFYRERGAGCYYSFSYLISVVFSDFPVNLLQALLFSVCMYFLVGLNLGVAGAPFGFFVGLYTQSVVCICVLSLLLCLFVVLPVPLTHVHPSSSRCPGFCSQLLWCIDGFAVSLPAWRCTQPERRDCERRLCYDRHSVQVGDCSECVECMWAVRFSEHEE
jgi:ABC-2 type transporter